MVNYKLNLIYYYYDLYYYIIKKIIKKCVHWLAITLRKHNVGEPDYSQ